MSVSFLDLDRLHGDPKGLGGGAFLHNFLAISLLYLWSHGFVGDLTPRISFTLQPHIGKHSMHTETDTTLGAGLKIRFTLRERTLQEVLEGSRQVRCCKEEDFYFLCPKETPTVSPGVRALLQELQARGRNEAPSFPHLLPPLSSCCHKDTHCWAPVLLLPCSPEVTIRPSLGLSSSE